MIKKHQVPQTIVVFCLIFSTRSTCSLQADYVRPQDQIENNEAKTYDSASVQLEAPHYLASGHMNVTQILLDQFAYVFNLTDSQVNSSNSRAQQQHQDSKQHLDRLTDLYVIGNGTQSASQVIGDDLSHQLQSSLETRTTIDNHYGTATFHDQLHESNKKNFVRILNRVFSRVELPDSFKARSSSSSTRSTSSSANLSSGSSQSNSAAGSHCGHHIGCIAELPNFPMILKLKPNVSASFTVYTPERGHKNGQRILFEPLMHYQLQDGDKLSDYELQREVVNITRHLKLDKLLPMMPHYKHNSRRHHHSSHHQSLARQELRHRLQTTAASWVSGGNRISTSKELPFDLSALEQSGFNSSLTTRVIIGGYFAKEDEEWIDEIIKQWLLLEPSNVIKVSWQDSNRGLYHSAAYNSRIVGRQLSLFLHYLNELFHIDLSRFHLVGHSLGAHIAGFVGADNEGQIARITGLDPAGPIFIELNQAHRLDPSDAKFVDVVHTNGGTITKGALGLSTPSGHVDYYCNGGSLQPGCFLSSVSMSIMDPVERIACNHRRSYRYFTEIIKLAIKQQRESTEGGLVDSALESESQQVSVDESKFPQAFLFEAKQEDLVKLVQPHVKLVRRDSEHPEAQAPIRKFIEFHSLNPDFPRDKHGLYYFRTRTEAPFFGSKQFALRFNVEQPIKRKITLLVKINTTLVGELELDELDDSHSLVFAPQNSNLIDHSSLFTGKSSRAPDLWLMWRQRSFNLLLAHQANELHMKSIELDLLDGPELENEAQTEVSRQKVEKQLDATTERPDYSSTSPASEVGSAGVDSKPQREQILSRSNSFIIRYEPNVINSKNSENFLSRIQNSNSNTGGSFMVPRNQWFKFDGRPVAIGN